MRIMRFIAAGTVVLFITNSAVAAADPQPPSSLDALARRLRREAELVRQQSSELEALIQQKRAEYATRELEHTREVIDRIPECLRNPGGCLKKPSIVDLFKLAKTEMERVLGTADALISLQGQLEGLVDRQLELNRKQIALHRDRQRAMNNRAAKPDAAPIHPLPPLPPPLQHKTLADADDDLDRWCWETKGDRCFDGKPAEFAAFLKRHPDARGHWEAAIGAPELDNSAKCILQKKTLSDTEAEAVETCAKFAGTEWHQECVTNWREAVARTVEGVQQACKDANVFLKNRIK
jgi:hypothetical protein